MNRIKQTIIALAIGLSLANCGDDFLDTTSSDQMSDSNTFTTIDGAQQVLTGAYDWLTNGWLAHMTNQYIFFLPDIMGDDALVTPDPNYNYGRFVSPYQYTVSPGSTYTDDPWKGCYSIIDNTNAILDNIGNLAESAERNRIEGEALSLRAYTRIVFTTDYYSIFYR